MREIYTDPDYTRVGYYQSILEGAGIPTYIRNQYSHHLLSEMPAGILHPQLCVLRDEDYAQALDLLRPFHEAQAATPSREADWSCPSCSESNPPGFELCWNCQGKRE